MGTVCQDLKRRLGGLVDDDFHFIRTCVISVPGIYAAGNGAPTCTTDGNGIRISQRTNVTTG